MQIDYPGRVDELCSFAEVEYGVESTPFRVLLSSLVPCPGYYPLWLICSSAKGPFWTDFYTAINRLLSTGVEVMDELRIIRPRYTRNRIEQWLGGRVRPRVFREIHYKSKYPKPSCKSRLNQLIAECLRIKLVVKTITPPAEGSAEELYRLMRLVVNPEHRKLTPRPISKLPEMMEYALRMLQMLSPEIEDGEALSRNARILAPSHAVLHGRDRLAEEDWWALYRTLLETLPDWTLRVLKAFADTEEHIGIPELLIETGLERDVIAKECSRLHRAQIINWPGPKSGSGGRKRWMRLTNQGEDVGRWVRGELRWW